MVAGVSSHPSFWAVLAATFDRGSTNHQQGVTTMWCWCPGFGPLKKGHSMGTLAHESRGGSLGSRWIPVCLLRVVCWLPTYYANLILPHGVSVPSRGGQPHWCCGEGVFFDRNKPLEQGSGPSPLLLLLCLARPEKALSGSGIISDARPYRVVPKRSGRTRARGDIMGGDGAVGHVQFSYSLLLHPSSSTVIFCGGSRGSTGSCTCKCWLKGSINRATEQVAEEAHRISLAAGSTDDAGVGRLLPNTCHEEACY